MTSPHLGGERSLAHERQKLHVLVALLALALPLALLRVSLLVHLLVVGLLVLRSQPQGQRHNGYRQKIHKRLLHFEQPPPMHGLDSSEPRYSILKRTLSQAAFGACPPPVLKKQGTIKGRV